MRTRTDLEGAFALLERVADAYTDDHDSSGPVEPDRLRADPERHAAVELIRPVTKRYTRRATVTAFAAAAAVVALGVGVASWVGRSDAHHGAADSPIANAYGPPARTVPFTLKPSLHMTIGDLDSNPDFLVDADLYSRTQRVELTLRRPDDGTRLGPGLTRVTINGRPGYYADGTGPALIDPDSTPKPTAPDAAPSTPADPEQYGPALAWEYAPKAWALIVVQGAPGTKAGLVHVARGIDFDGHQHAVRIPLTLTSVSKGLRLTSYDVTYASTPRSAKPYDLDPSAWIASAIYLPRRGSGISVGVIPVRTESERAPYRKGRPAVVNGHPARLITFPDGLHLRIDMGGDVFVDIMEQSGDADGPATMTAAQLEAVGATVRLASSPDTRSTWVDLRKALP